MEGEGEVKSYVLDTSVVIKWFSEYDEDDLDKAIGIRNEIVEGICDITVPCLMLYELGNALRYNPRFKESDVKNAVKSIFDMGFNMRKIDGAVMESAIETAFKFRTTVYDAYFLALSRTENKPFITADYEFAEQVKGVKGIIRLSDI
jgi:predicted nucleic acid-binding protein